MFLASRLGISAAFVLLASGVALGQAPANRGKPFGAHACGPADPAYIRTANETGGIPMFLEPSEAGKAFHFVRESTRNNVATVFWATGSLSAGRNSIRIPVDSATLRMTFTFSTDSKGNELKLTTPGGAIVIPAANTEITELNCGRIITLTAPEAGEWCAEIAGTGRYWLEAQAQSDIFLVSTEFVKSAGRPGHEGLFRIPGQPLLGTGTLRVSVSAGQTETNEFYLVSAEGQDLQKVHLRAVNSDREFREFVGDVDLGPAPFRVAVRGRDQNGNPYQRFFPSLFHAESVEISPQLDFDELSPGATRQAVFTVRNLDTPRTFRITVTDTQRFLAQVEPKELSLGAGESRTVRVDLAVPQGTKTGIRDDVVLLASSIQGPATSNSSVVHFSVSGRE
jgi:von Willebrand factor A domain-containing protein 7